MKKQGAEDREDEYSDDEEQASSATGQQNNNGYMARYEGRIQITQ